MSAIERVQQLPLYAEVCKLLNLKKAHIHKANNRIEFGPSRVFSTSWYYLLRLDGRVQVQSMNAKSWTTLRNTEQPIDQSADELVRCFNKNLSFLKDRLLCDIQLNADKA